MKLDLALHKALNEKLHKKNFFRDAMFFYFKSPFLTLEMDTQYLALTHL